MKKINKSVLFSNNEIVHKCLNANMTFNVYIKWQVTDEALDGKLETDCTNDEK
uniref:Uncharacterized protein n=1 Tax=Arion vulgaris TaxID=1028688 RepID=A0A0B6Z9M8_9EUPU